jgi:hypothetical protein
LPESPLRYNIYTSLHLHPPSPILLSSSMHSNFQLVSESPADKLFLVQVMRPRPPTELQSSSTPSDRPNVSASPPSPSSSPQLLSVSRRGSGCQT